MIKPHEQGDQGSRHSPEGADAAIDHEIEQRVRTYANASEAMLDQRIRRLEREWDAGQGLELSLAGASLLGIALGVATDRRWLAAVPGVALAFLAQHAVQGWSPPVPLLRRMGFRTRREIEQERYALKLLRGDLDDVLPARRSQDLDRVLEAVRR